MSSSSSVWLKGDKVLESTLQVNLEITTIEVIQGWFRNDFEVDNFFLLYCILTWEKIWKTDPYR